jgi:hypothetical protein
VIRTNVRGEPIEPAVDEVAVTRVFDDDSRSETYRMGVESGQASGHPGLPTVLTWQQARWDDRALVIETRGSAGSTESGRSERREVWSLDSRGRLRLAVTVRTSTQTSRTVIVLYRRQ